MKNYSYIGISLVVLIFGILFIPKIIDRVSENNVVSSSRSDTAEERKRKEESAELAYIEVNGKRKQIPPFEFVNQDGDTITDEDYRGKVYIAEFFFTSCPTICPIMNQNLLEAQKEFRDEADFAIASFSIDPEHDTPEVLSKYAEQHGMDHANWHLLTGDRDRIFDLANSGFNIYAGEDPNAAGGFAHSGYFALIDQEGYVRSRLDNFGNPIVYYRGSVEKDAVVQPGEEEPQIEILIEDAKKLL